MHAVTSAWAPSRQHTWLPFEFGQAGHARDYQQKAFSRTYSFLTQAQDGQFVPAAEQPRIDACEQTLEQDIRRIEQQPRYAAQRSPADRYKGRSRQGFTAMHAHLHVKVVVQAVLDVPALAVIAQRPIPVLPKDVRPNLHSWEPLATSPILLTSPAHAALRRILMGPACAAPAVIARCPLLVLPKYVRPILLI